MSVAVGTRFCAACGGDISDRHVATKRCAPCAETHKAKRAAEASAAARSVQDRWRPTRLPTGPNFGEIRNTLARSRAEGLAFNEAWQRAVGRSESYILASTKAGWQRAYDGAPPTRGEVAAGRMLEVLDV